MTKMSIEPGPFVIPMPLALVGADIDGKPNFMPAAFMGIVNFNPVVVACGLNPEHLTCKGIVEHKAFSLNLPPPELVKPTDWCGIWSGEKKDKSDLFETFRGDLAGAPMISACRLSTECKLTQTVELAIDTVYFGEVVSVHADEEALTDGKPDWKKIDPLLFTFPDKGYWKLGDYVAKAWSVGKGYR